MAESTSSTPPVLDTPQDPVSVRKTHLTHEASIKSIGLLYYLAAVIMPVAAISEILRPAGEDKGLPWYVLVLLLVMALVYAVVGRWFRTLNPKARIPGAIISVLGLLAFPVGTLINGYILYLIFAKKSKVVFAEDYRAVIAATPEIKYKTSVLVWILAGLLVVVLVGVFAAMILAK